MKSGRQWPAIIVGLLLLAGTANGILVFLAIRNPSFAVEPDFYQKAVDWDKTREQERKNRELGWKVELLAPNVVPTGRSEVGILLLDPVDRPIENASVTLEAFHLARAAEVQNISFREEQPGRYISSMETHRSGLWEFRFTIDRGSSTFTALLQTNLEPLQ